MTSSLPREYLAFDVETTGLNPAVDRVVEFAAVRFDGSGRELGQFERLVNPGRPVSPGALAVHGLTDAFLADQPPARDVLPAFVEFLGDPASTTLLAHNASFDASFLAHELARIGRKPLAHPIVDTLTLARARLPHLGNHRLDSLARVLDLDPSGPHRALADSRRVKGLWLALGGDRPGAEARPLVARRADPAIRPAVWDAIDEAIARGWHVRIEYAGGTRGTAPRDVTPRALQDRGGVAYLVAFCHKDAIEKQFRLDRVQRFEVIRTIAVGTAAPEPIR